MSKGRRIRSRAKRRQLVHQAMHPDPVSDPCRGPRKGATSRSKRSQARVVRPPLLSLIPQLIIASININGLCPETEWAISALLEEHRYDVSCVSLYY